MRISTVSSETDKLLIGWQDGTESAFHYIWLRDNCHCAECRHPEALERTLDPAIIPLDIKPTTVTHDGQLRLTWPDGHRTQVDEDWLYRHAYEPEARVARQFQPVLWDTAAIQANLPEVTYDAIMADEEGLLSWLRQLRQYGFTIIRSVPNLPSQVLRVAQRVAYVRETNFGIIFDVESIPDPNSIAYTAHKLNAHTDLVSREAQPGLQFLHCLESAAEGGESILVDGFAAAEELKHRHPEDYEFLTTHPIRFRYQDRDTDISFKSPMIRLDADGNYFEVRYSTALLAPLDIDPHLVAPFYRAYQNFSHVLRDPRFEFKFKLQAGDCEVFDNRRVLHGRAAFNPQSGRRHLQGCYVETDDFLSRVRVLERQAA